MTVDPGAPEIVAHPWNEGFAWHDHPGPHTTVTAEDARRFDRDGCFVVRGALGADEIAALRRDLDAVDAETETLLRGLDGERLMIAEAGAITFAPHVVTRSEVARGVARHPVLVGLCADLVGPEVRLYWDQLVYKKPEKPRRFPWHQDNGYTFVEPQQYLTCWIALGDAGVEHGCPWFVPGLHRVGTLRHRYVEPLGWECFRDHPDARPVPVRAGDVVVLSSLTPHLTGPNTSDEVRRAYILQYAPDGAAVLRGDPDAGPPTSREPCDDPERRFPVLVAGVPAT